MKRAKRKPGQVYVVRRGKDVQIEWVPKKGLSKAERIRAAAMICGILV